MYKVYFEQLFIDCLDNFILSMKNYYYNFYSNTWIYDIDKITDSYFDIYEKMKTEVFNEINSICISWILWRKVLYKSNKIENCSFIFKHWNYTVYFSATKNNNNNEIVVNGLKIVL